MNYDAQNWALLAAQLQRDHTAIHVLNRAQIMDDALNLAKSGILVVFYCEPSSVEISGILCCRTTLQR